MAFEKENYIFKSYYSKVIDNLCYLQINIKETSIIVHRNLVGAEYKVDYADVRDTCLELQVLDLWKH